MIASYASYVPGEPIKRIIGGKPKFIIKKLGKNSPVKSIKVRVNNRKLTNK